MANPYPDRIIGNPRFPREEITRIMQDDNALNALSFGDIRYLRTLFPDQSSQNKLSGYDRRSFARELMAEDSGSPAANLLNKLGAFTLPVLSAGEEALKYAGYNRGRSQANLGNVFHTATGVAEGLGQSFTDSVANWKNSLGRMLP